MFLSVVILGRFTTETHAMALLRQGPTRRHHLHHSPGRSPGIGMGTGGWREDRVYYDKDVEI